MDNYALDANIVIHYLKKQPNVFRKLREAISNGSDIVIPKMVDYELRRGFRAKSNPKKELAYEILLEDCPVSEMNTLSWEKATHVYANLYQKRFTVGEMDMLIAAFCLANNFTLVTNNASDFENIENLSIEDWTKQQ
jgi:tRNA(fMet)-specific endonuclease VapC